MRAILFTILVTCLFTDLFPQSAESLWHDKERTVRYKPEGNDFVIVNGKRKFVRALYGTNTGFRIEAGDLPEFALYMPGMGGNFKLGIWLGNKSKWLTEASYIKAIYRPGSMIYEIKDPILGNGILYLTVLALADTEGLILKTEAKNITGKIELVCAFGGASGKKFSRDGDIGADPESSFYLHADNCKDNSYTLDKNSFHLLYGTGKVLTEEERYEIQHLPAANTSSSTAIKNLKQLSGLFPPAALLKISDAQQQQTPAGLYTSSASSSPVVTTKIPLAAANYFLIQNSPTVQKDYGLLKTFFDQAEAARKKLADRIKVVTPDKYVNTIGGALSVAADAIWEDPSYLHGAIAWRMRLNAWRGAYVADPLGWHDRARKHFSSYALSQVTTPPVTGVVMDTALHLARHQEKIGTALFSDGYICRNPNGDIRAHHYDMNLVFVDQLLNHFNWTGDTAYVREMWPLLTRHLAWEKRNFDADDDGLYDAYAAIWASDALQYSGGGVTHSSAYNYRANKMVAELAKLIGKDGSQYEKEAAKIYNAVQKELWLPGKGWYAEYKDLLGNKLVHPYPGLWTIYHVVDSKLPDAFQAYQSLNYVYYEIPKIPVKAKGWDEKNLYIHSTSNWQPYTWSVNNVALAENLHTALAYWQSGRNGIAYNLWRSAILESMYLSASPGGFQQLSFYDAVRGELYRDFADPIGMAGRTLVEGLFGIQPNALYDSLTIHPGYPDSWNNAELQVPDIHYSFSRKGNTDNYIIKQSFPKALHLKLLLRAQRDNARVFVNGKPVKWTATSTINNPMIQVEVPAAEQYSISVVWSGNEFDPLVYNYAVWPGEEFIVVPKKLRLLQVYDPLKALSNIRLKANKLTAKFEREAKHTSLFLKVSQGAFTWWKEMISLQITISTLEDIPPFQRATMEKVNLGSYYNDKVTNIFKQQYLSPRPASPTLQLPTQGIGNWCYPMITANIDDSGTRAKAGAANEIMSWDSIPFQTPSDTSRNNIVFTSQWDNYPDSVTIPLSGSAFKLALLMAGTTNPMQSNLENGTVVVHYTDGTKSVLSLYNPDTWWPIEQDYYDDGYAFSIPRAETFYPGTPVRLHLKDGSFTQGGKGNYTSIKGFSNRAIDGGAATVLKLSLDPKKTLSSMTIHAVANDVVIGLMAATLLREK